MVRKLKSKRAASAINSKKPPGTKTKQTSSALKLPAAAPKSSASGAKKYVSASRRREILRPSLKQTLETVLSQQKQAKQALHETEERFRFAFELAPNGMALVGLDGRFVQVNRFLCELLGYSEKELQGKTFSDVSHPAEVEASLQGLRKMRAGKLPVFELEKRYITKSGSIVLIHLRTSIVRDYQGRPLYCVSHMQDITERRRAEEALRESEDRYRQLVEFSPDAILMHRAGKLVFGNPAFFKLLGASSPEVLLGTRILDFVHPDYRSMVQERIDRVLGGDKGVPLLEQKLIRLDGTVIDVEVAPIAFHSQGEMAVLSIIRDITARKKANQESLLLTSLIDNSSDFIGFASLKGEILYINAGGLKMTGLDSLEEARSKTVFDFHEPEDLADLQKRILPALTATGAWQGESRWKHFQTGALFPIHINAFLIKDSQTGQPLAMATINRDITEQKRHEEILRKHEAQLAEAQQIARMGSWEWDLATNMAAWSDENYRLFGFKPRDRTITYDVFIQLVHPEDRDSIQQILARAIRDKKATVFEFRVVLPNGDQRLFQSRGEVILNEQGEPVRMVGTSQDVTERKLAEAERERLFQEVEEGRDRLQQLSRRLVEVQESERRAIARELHDEIGQELTVLKLNLERSASLSGEASRQSLLQAQQRTNQLLNTVRELSLNLRPTMLDDLGLLPALFWHFDRFMAASPVRVQFKHTGLEQRRFRPEIETGVYRIVQEALTNVVRHAQTKHVTVWLWANDDTLSLQIEDDGIGFHVETALRAGNSSGLSGMRERAALLGGHFTIESVPGSGTNLTARLPLDEKLRRNSVA